MRVPAGFGRLVGYLNADEVGAASGLDDWIGRAAKQLATDSRKDARQFVTEVLHANLEDKKLIEILGDAHFEYHVSEGGGRVIFESILRQLMDA